MSNGANASAARQAALAYLRRHHVMSLATVGPEGVWAAAVFYAADQFNLIFLSAGHSRHGQNIAANPQVAATIQEDYQEWPAIQGIQLEGVVQRLQEEPRRRAAAFFAARYPFLAQAEAPLRAALAQVNWYRLTPRRLYFVDNSRGFGHRDEIAL
jgi:uncharacterized protein